MAAPRELDLTVTLEAALEMWEQDLRRRVAAQTLSPETLRNYVQYSKRAVAHLGPARTCDSVTAEEIVEMLAGFRDGGATGARGVSSAQQLHKGIRGVMEFADKKRWLRENPMRDVPRPSGRVAHTARPERRALTRPELDAMIRAAANGHGSYQGGSGMCVRDEIVIRLAGESGLRNADIRNLDLGDIEATPSGAWVAQVRCGKGRKSRTVPLSDACARLIADWVEKHRPRPAASADRYDPYGKLIKGAEHALLLTYQSHRLTSGAIQHIVSRCAKHALGRHYVPHGLRHTTGTLLAREAKADPALIAHVLGHNDISVTSVYLDTSDDEAVAAVNRRKVGARPKAPTVAPPGPGDPCWPECGTKEGWKRHRDEKIAACMPCRMWYRDDLKQVERRRLERDVAAKDKEIAALLAEVRQLRERVNAQKGRHGTARAYREHLRLEEEPCDECRAAYEDARSTWAPCGSTGGEQFHRQWGEKACDACRIARNLGNLERRGRPPSAASRIIRVWARAQGYEVDETGTIPPAALCAWAQAAAADSTLASLAAGALPAPKPAPAFPGGHIRAWANANGYDVLPRGRVPEHVLAAYHAAHAEPGAAPAAGAE